MGNTKLNKEIARLEKEKIKMTKLKDKFTTELIQGNAEGVISHIQKQIDYLKSLRD